MTDFDPELLRFYSKSKLRELQKSTDLTMRQKYELIKITQPIDENTHEYKIVGNGFVVRKKGVTRRPAPKEAPEKEAPKSEPNPEAPKEAPKVEEPGPSSPPTDPFKDLKKYLS